MSQALKNLKKKKAPVANATLSLPDGQKLELPMYKGILGPDVIDVSPLKKVDLFTYDPGFVATASCSSAVTYIDGDKGELLYRGYPIENLAAKASFLQVCYLLYHGEMATPAQFRAYKKEIIQHTMVTERGGGLYQRGLTAKPIRWR